MTNIIAQEKRQPRAKVAGDQQWPSLAQVAVVSTALKILLFPAYRSTDFEVHRNWMAITHSLPVKQWYYEATSEWTLDYPPAFAAFEWLLSLPASIIDPAMLQITNLGYSSWATVAYQRSTVILTELVLVASLQAYVSSSPAATKKQAHAIALSILLSPGLLIIDHIHFQYNGVMYGILIASIVLIRRPSTMWLGGALFALLLSMKHIYLYLAPAYFVYLLRVCVLDPNAGFLPPRLQLANIAKLGGSLVAIFGASFGPFAYWGQLIQLRSRLFPFSRGLCHAYWAPNIWALYSFADRVLIVAAPYLRLDVNKDAVKSVTRGLVGDSSFAVLPNITPQHCFGLTLAFQTIALAKLWTRPSWDVFVGSLTLCGYASFLVGWHVHEKAILLVLIPFSFLALKDRSYLASFRPLAVAGHVSLFPLLFTVPEFPIKVLYTSVWLTIFLFVFDKLAPAPATPRRFLLDRFTVLYMALAIPLLIYTSLLHSLFFDARFEFLPLLLTSVYSAVGVVSPAVTGPLTKSACLPAYTTCTCPLGARHPAPAPSTWAAPPWAMVLFKRKAVSYLNKPVISDDADDIWVIPQTDEVFTSYESYLQRMDWYKQKRFTCEVSGRSGLSYFDALRSETAGSREVEQAFPEPLKSPVLRRVQFSTTSRIDNLVDEVYEDFKNDFYPGEIVTVVLDDGQRLNGRVRDKAKFAAALHPDGTIKRKAFSRYFVRLVDRPDEEALVDDEHIVRDRKTFTKQMLRSFIKNCVHRESWNGAPWLVKQNVADELHIPTEVPPHLQHGYKLAERKAQRRAERQEGQRAAQWRPEQLAAMQQPANYEAYQPPPFAPYGWPPAPLSTQYPLPPGYAHMTLAQGQGQPNGYYGPLPPHITPKFEAARPAIKYPIDDMDVEPQRDGTHRPALNFVVESQLVDGQASDSSDIIPGLEEPVVGVLLEIWNTLNVYSQVLKLDSFTFDDFVDAMRFSSDEVECELLVEMHCAVLKKLPTPEPEYPAKRTRSSLNKVQFAQPAPVEEVNEADDSEIKIHRAAEMLGEYGWIQRLRKRDFSNGGWEMVMIGLLHQLAGRPRLTDVCNTILAHWAPLDAEPTIETARLQYLTMDINLRARALETICQLFLETKTVKTFLEEKSNTMTYWRKIKIQHQRARKDAIAKLKNLELERRLLAPTPEKSPEPTTELEEGAESVDAERTEDGDGEGSIPDSEDEDVLITRSLRRGPDRAAMRKRKREEEAEREAKKKEDKQHKGNKELQKVIKQIDKERDKIDEAEEKIMEVDEHLRKADCHRTRVLGKDRFCNRYWWFERNAMPHAGHEDSSTHDAEYANGRVWVQGPDEMERVGYIDVAEDEKANYAHRFQVTPAERKKMEEGPTQLQGADQWGFYDKADEIDMLIGWLDPRGLREMKLKKELTLQRDTIVKYMENRHAFLASRGESDEQAAAAQRKSTRAKASVPVSEMSRLCLRWENRLAVREEGHRHQDAPPAKKGRGRKAAVHVEIEPVTTRRKAKRGRASEESVVLNPAMSPGILSSLHASSSSRLSNHLVHTEHRPENSSEQEGNRTPRSTTAYADSDSATVASPSKPRSLSDAKPPVLLPPLPALDEPNNGRRVSKDDSALGPSTPRRTSMPHSRGLDYTRACTNLHHSTLAESSPDASPITGRGVPIPHRRSLAGSSVLDSPSNLSALLWSAMPERTTLSSSVSSINMLDSDDETDTSSDDMALDDDPLLTTPAASRLGRGLIGGGGSIGGGISSSPGMDWPSPQPQQQTPQQAQTQAQPSLMSSFPMSFRRARLKRGKSQHSSSSVSMAGSLSPSTKKAESTGYFAGLTRARAQSRRESLNLGTTNLRLSDGDDNKPGGASDGDGSSTHGPAGVVRRAVTRRGNLLPKTKGFARIKAALMEEATPADSELRREAEVIKQVHDNDPTFSPNKSPHSLNPFSPDLVQHSIEDSSAAIVPESKIAPFSLHAERHSAGLGFWNAFDGGRYSTPPPGFRPREDSSVISDDANDIAPNSLVSDQHRGLGSLGRPRSRSTTPLANTGPPTAADVARRVNNKRRLDDDFDPAYAKRRAVSPGISVASSPVLPQSPVMTADKGWGKPPPKTPTAAAAERSNSTSTLSNGLKKVGMQGMNETNEGLLSMSID
ncbi:hypothetical protein DV738_g1311, partial [Chaetothyriales sp. CBS 135597]